ncbi:MAG: hypothetical protein DSO07_00045 [Thermoproteota archaeon]|uniref:Uncharacterized protein n=2 Tax=Candidatus Methanodesulfokora washburnensis TaxID=2478471 RepID=A0A3R9R3I9_9CREN|nr:hypothetical protein D6D85_08855 [Candidatus Methanodesulfokores washburnensis]TDA42301.1 MAG: hypothetical protein DSO07_00045 [Candidatus Korarchaeota archaeon]
MGAMERELTPTEIAIKYLRTQYTGEIIFLSFFVILLFLIINVLLIYYYGLIPTISTIVGILTGMFRTLKRRGKRALSPLERPELRKLCEGYGDQAYIELRKELSSKIEVTTPFYLGLIVLTMIAGILSPNKLNLEVLNDIDGLFVCTFGPWLSSFTCSAGSDFAIFPTWRSMRALEKFFKEHPIKTLPPTIRRWWAREMAVKSGKRPALITGLSLLFYTVGISLFVEGLVTMIFGFIGFPIYEQLDLISRELTGLPLHGPNEDLLREAVGAGLGLMAIGVFFLVSARWMWKLMKEGAIIAILASAIPITFGIFFVMDHPEKLFNYLLIIIPSIIILLIKHEWKKFM